MNERSKIISKLKNDKNSRWAYVKAKLGVLVPSQIRALRLKSNMPRQQDLAMAAEMQQSRISMLEMPGAANVTLETLARLAAVFKVGLMVKFVPFNEMLNWENTFSQDEFNVLRLNNDEKFLNPVTYSEPDDLGLQKEVGILEGSLGDPLVWYHAGQREGNLANTALASITDKQTITASAATECFMPPAIVLSPDM